MRPPRLHEFGRDRPDFGFIINLIALGIPHFVRPCRGQHEEFESVGASAFLVLERLHKRMDLRSWQSGLMLDLGDLAPLLQQLAKPTVQGCQIIDFAHPLLKTLSP